MKSKVTLIRSKIAANGQVGVQNRKAMEQNGRVRFYDNFGVRQISPRTYWARYYSSQRRKPDLSSATQRREAGMSPMRWRPDPRNLFAAAVSGNPSLSFQLSIYSLPLFLSLPQKECTCRYKQNKRRYFFNALTQFSINQCIIPYLCSF